MIKRLWARHRWMVVGFVVAVVLFLAFGLRALLLFPEHGNPHLPVAPWMTPRFVVHTYDLPPEVVGSILNLPKGERPKETLQQIADRSGVPVMDLVRALQAAVEQQRAAQGGDKAHD